MLIRVACIRCQLASLWTDEPRCFLATVCRDPRRCEATFRDEEFASPDESLPTRLSEEPGSTP
jgi:hypothetical protein